MQRYTEILNRSKSNAEVRRIEVNKKRHENFVTLILSTLNLIDDNLFIRELFKKHEIFPEFTISDQNKLNTREEVIVKFQRLIPEICAEQFSQITETELPKRREFLPEKISTNKFSKETNIENKIIKKTSEIKKLEKYAFDEKCYNLIKVLHELVLKDFSNNYNLDILQILFQNNMSPLSQSAINRTKNQTNSDENIEYVKLFQRLIRSEIRKNLHIKLFHKKPNEYYSIPKNIKENYRIVKCIYDLIANHSIISKIQYHWTTDQNLRSIIRSLYFYGNLTLEKKEKVFFRKNALDDGDVDNGDDDIFCCCPHMVDFLAFYNKRDDKFKSGIVRLVLDITKNKTDGNNNEFFKLFDLWSPAFKYKVRINKDLTITFEREKRGENVFLTIELKGKTSNINIYDSSTLSKDAAICYGNLYTINRFCLLTFFTFLSKSEDKSFENFFINYLTSCQENEIKKILTIIGQSLTIFSEYNFNSSLQLTPNLIKEIHYVDKNVTYRIPNLTEHDYHSALSNLVIDSNINNHIREFNEALFSRSDLYDEFEICLYGSKINTKSHFIEFKEQDFSDCSPELFNESDYIETRPKGKESSQKRHVMELSQEIIRQNNLHSASL